jgi:hypothetical protein
MLGYDDRREIDRIRCHQRQILLFAPLPGLVSPRERRYAISTQPHKDITLWFYIKSAVLPIPPPLDAPIRTPYTLPE